MDTKRKNIIIKITFWAGLGLAQFVLFTLLSMSDRFLAMHFRFFEWQKAPHQKLFSYFPFSFGDLLYAASIIVLIFGLLRFFLTKNLRILVRIFIGLNVVYLLYQIFWGLLYFQPLLMDNFSKKTLNQTQVESIATHLLKNCVDARKSLPENQRGVFVLHDKTELQRAILHSQNTLPNWINKRKPNSLLSMKPSVFGLILSYTGISGYYNPFTAEVQYDRYLPSSNIGFTLAHESAHQMGYAREQEASFISYLTGENSDNAALKYSVNLVALRYVLRDLTLRNDVIFLRKIKSEIPSAIKRDLEFEKEFEMAHQGWLDEFFKVTNHWFLLSNQQDGSITYSYFTDLLLQYKAQEMP